MPDGIDTPDEPLSQMSINLTSSGELQAGPVTQTPTANTASGAVQAFRDIRRELSEAELSNPGVQRLILDRLDSALARCDALSGFESRFHERDKRVEVLEERLRKRVALDIAWSGGLSIGLALLTLTPVVWHLHPHWIRDIFLAIGALLFILAIAMRVVLK